MQMPYLANSLALQVERTKQSDSGNRHTERFRKMNPMYNQPLHTVVDFRLENHFQDQMDLLLEVLFETAK